MAESNPLKVPSDPRLRPAIILVQPQEEGNIGSAARAMANMGLQRLILVEPAPPLGGIARGFGVGGWSILEDCERYASFEEAISGFQRLVGTASRRARSLRETPPIMPRELPTSLMADPPQTKTALVFGCESSGLRRQDLERCHPIVSVPCAAEQPTLNLAQAVLLVTYELLIARLQESETFAGGGTLGDSEVPASEVAPTTTLATVDEVQDVLGTSSQVLHRIGYDQEHIHLGLMRDLQRLVSRATMSRREARLLRRLLNRARGALGNSEG